ncbi:hypothetical protein BIWAKO_05355 [Bosea sp. BIWAKO-01]|nr:hypothetical protein BIWAKO_05355 [Bosea sp. BIWAKO-01]
MLVFTPCAAVWDIAVSSPVEIAICRLVKYRLVDQGLP